MNLCLKFDENITRRAPDSSGKAKKPKRTSKNALDGDSFDLRLKLDVDLFERQRNLLAKTGRGAAQEYAERILLNAHSFDSGRGGLSPEGYAKLGRVARWVTDTGHTVVIVIANEQHVPFALQSARAKEVTTELEGLGVSRIRLRTAFESQANKVSDSSGELVEIEVSG